MIRSHQNPLVKKTIRLRKSSKRREEGRFLIDGKDELLAAISAEFRIETVFLSPELCPLEAEFRSRTKQTLATDFVVVSPEILAKLSYGERGEHPVGVGITPDFSAARLELTNRSLILVLDQTEKPGNLGDA